MPQAPRDEGPSQREVADVPVPAFWPEEFKRLWSELRGARRTPVRLALAGAIGLFVGCQPILGVHTLIVLSVCMWLRLDAVIALLASTVSNPLSMPFLLAAEVRLGSLLLQEDTAHFGPELARDAGLEGVLLPALVGAFVLGAALALAGAGLLYLAVHLKQLVFPQEERLPYRLPDDSPAWWLASESIARRFYNARRDSPADRAQFHYVRIKLLRDPVMKMVADLGLDRSLGKILDVGTGRGQLPLMLLALGRADTVLGIDWDHEKVEAATQAARQEPFLSATFQQADVREASLERADTVLLIDVLHYLDDEAQDDLLERAAAAVRPGGRLLVREADTEGGFRSLVTLVEEKFFTALKVNRGPRVRFRAVRVVTETLQEWGFEVDLVDAQSGTPFSNMLVVATRGIDAPA